MKLTSGATCATAGQQWDKMLPGQVLSLLFAHARHQLDPGSVRANYVGRALGIFAPCIHLVWLMGSGAVVGTSGANRHSCTPYYLCLVKTLYPANFLVGHKTVGKKDYRLPREGKYPRPSTPKWGKERKDPDLRRPSTTPAGTRSWGLTWPCASLWCARVLSQGQGRKPPDSGMSSQPITTLETFR